MITNILLSTLFACSVVTSAPINNYDNQKHNAVNENAFVLDDNNYFITDDNVYYRYNSKPSVNYPGVQMGNLLDTLATFYPYQVDGEPLVSFTSNLDTLIKYNGIWYKVYSYVDDNQLTRYKLVINQNGLLVTYDGDDLVPYGRIDKSYYFTMRFYVKVDYDTHKNLFNRMTDKNGQLLYRDFKPIIELGILNNYFEYNFVNAFQIRYSYPNDDIYNGTLNSLYFDYQSIEFLETNGTETSNNFGYENYYSDELDILSAYYPNADPGIWYDFTDVYYVSIGSMLYSFFENYIFLKPNENYKNDLYLDLVKYFYFADNYGTTEFDDIEINYIYNDMHFNVIDIYVERTSTTSIEFSIYLKDTSRNLIITLIDYQSTYNWDDFSNYLTQNNLSNELFLIIDTSLNSASFNFIRTLDIIQLGEQNNNDIGIFNIFDLLSGGLLGIGAILSVMVLPGITIGMLLFLPFLALILFFIISLFKR